MMHDIIGNGLNRQAENRPLVLDIPLKALNCTIKKHDRNNFSPCGSGCPANPRSLILIKFQWPTCNPFLKIELFPCICSSEKLYFFPLFSLFSNASIFVVWIGLPLCLRPISPPFFWPCWIDRFSELCLGSLCLPIPRRLFTISAFLHCLLKTRTNLNKSHDQFYLLKLQPDLDSCSVYHPLPPLT